MSLFLCHLFFLSLLDHPFWTKYNVQWNVSVFINEAIKEHNRMDKFLTRLCENSLRIIFVLLSKQQHLSVWRSRPIALSFQYLTGKEFFRMYLVSHGITSAKHIVKHTVKHNKTHSKTRWRDFLFIRHKIWINLRYWQL